jgi:hypothetical protein
VITHVEVDEGQRFDLALVRVVDPLPAPPGTGAVELVMELLNRVRRCDGDGAHRFGSPGSGLR